MKHRRGTSVASTLLLIFICVGLAFTLTSLAFHHLNLSNRLSNSQQARNLAESAISLSIEKILKAEGDYPRPGQHTVIVHFPDLDSQDLGVTSFNATVANGYALQPSTNNLKNPDSIKAPGGRLIPRESVHLVGLGRCRGLERRVEAILHLPIYRSALSSEAPLDAQGPVLVASAENSADDNLLTHPENFLSKLLPAHVTSNQDAQLGQDVLITGFCQAVGAIDLGAGNATVKGGLRPQGGRSEVPALKPQDFDTAKLGATNPLKDLSPGVFRAQGLVKVKHDVVGSELLLPDGNNHSGAIVYIEGDLRIKEIRGVGAVITTGQLSVTNSTNLSTDGSVALISGGNLSLVGEKPDADAIIKGIVYSGKSLTASNVTIVGTAVQAGSGAADVMRIEKSNMVKTDDSVDFEFDMPFGPDAGQGFRIKLDLKNHYDAATDSYAKDVNGDGQFTSPEDSPRQPIQLKDWVLVDAAGKTITPAQAAQTWVGQAEPVPLGPKTTWAELGCSNPPTAADLSKLEDYIVKEAIPDFHGRFADNFNRDLVSVEAFYQKFSLQNKAQGKISFNPTRFMTLTQAARVILWKDL